MDIRQLFNGPVAPGDSGIDIGSERMFERRKLIRAVQSLNQSQWFGGGNEVLFSVDRHTHRPVIRIVSRDSGDVVQQLPPEYVLRLAEDLGTAGPSSTVGERSG